MLIGILDASYAIVLGLLLLIQTFAYIQTIRLFRKLKIILNPLSKRQLNETEAQYARRLEVQKAFTKGYKSFFRNFVNTIFVLTVRLAVFCYEKYQSYDIASSLDDLEELKVSPIIFYIVFLTEIFITMLVLVLVWGSTRKNPATRAMSGDSQTDYFEQRVPTLVESLRCGR